MGAGARGPPAGERQLSSATGMTTSSNAAGTPSPAKRPVSVASRCAAARAGAPAAAAAGAPARRRSPCATTSGSAICPRRSAAAGCREAGSGYRSAAASRRSGRGRQSFGASGYVTLGFETSARRIRNDCCAAIARDRRLIDIQTQLLDILRRQNDRGQIALPDVVAQETAAAQARCCCRRWSASSRSSATCLLR